MILFIDDKRKPEDIYSLSYRDRVGMKPFSEHVKNVLLEQRNKPECWHFAKSYQEAIDLLADPNNQYDLIFFDHELHDHSGYPTGYDVAKWIVNNLNYSFAYCSHSSYPEGRERIESLLAEYHNNLKNNEKAKSLSLLREAIKQATETGLFDELVSYCSNPNSINDVCDAVDHLLTEWKSV